MVPDFKESEKSILIDVCTDILVPLRYLHCYRDSKVCRVLMHLFGVVQAHR
jgi:hypothetical protein